MRQTKSFILIVLLTMPLTAAGCRTSRFTLLFNDRTVEVEELRQASFPRGLKISFFDGRLMKLTGREAINLNGTDLAISGSTIRFGKFKGEVASDQKLVITAKNSFRIEDQNPTESSKSWWEFWR